MEFNIGPLQILAKIVEPGEMRYDTIGDWQYDTLANVLTITMVRMAAPRYQKALFTHELHEAQLCLSLGISSEEIDRFDQEYERARGFGAQVAPCGCSFTEDSEPGDDIHAPYYNPHQDASIVERLLIAHLKENWGHYENACQRMLEAVRRARKETHDERRNSAGDDAQDQGGQSAQGEKAKDL